MHSSSDRDDYVTIYLENVIRGTEGNFRKYNSRDFSNFGTSYDYNSIMHYDRYSFSANGKITIQPKDSSYLYVIGQRDGLSPNDILRIKRMYNCN
jgi:hypothetical protein